MTRRTVILCSMMLALSGCNGRQSTTSLSAQSTPPPGLYEGMGPYHRQFSTSSPEAQRYLDQAMTWMYAFNHDEAIRSFKHAASLDPQCAMAWWGVALCNGPHINRPAMTDQQWAQAWAALERARSLRHHATPAEQEFIDALATRYASKPVTDRRELDEAYAAAMGSLYASRPDDADVCVLYAESLMNLQPWDLWDLEGKPKGRAEEIVGIIERAIALAPDHPGALHLYIHATEASSNPGRAAVAADRLRNLVPASGHLVHMPSHVDVRTGLWARAAQANDRAVIIDAAYRELSPRQDFYRLYMAHNHHFLSFVEMMRGRREAAQQAARAMIAGVPKSYLQENASLVDPYMFIEIEVLMRFGRWDELLAHPDPGAKLPITRAFWRFTRGVALAALGRINDAERERERYRRALAAVPEGAYMSINNARNVLAVATSVLDAEIEYRKGKMDSAIAHLREAVRREDALIYMEPPEWLQPVRHTLGAFLIDAGRHAEAETVYREDLARWPENGWSLFGLEQSLRGQGRDSEADEVKQRFERAWADADTKIGATCLCAQKQKGPRASR